MGNKKPPLWGGVGVNMFIEKLRFEIVKELLHSDTDYVLHNKFDKLIKDAQMIENYVTGRSEQKGICPLQPADIADIK